MTIPSRKSSEVSAVGTYTPAQCQVHASRPARVLTSKMIYDHQGGEPERACIVDLMFCHGTQIMNNSRICCCLLFHEHGK